MVTAPVVAIASQLAGERVSVSCERNQSFNTEDRAYTLWTDSDGTVIFDPVIHLAAGTCDALNRLVVRDGRPHAAVKGLATNGGTTVDIPDAGAVHLLLHEALHIRESSTDEARVECDTSLNAWSALRLFKLPAWRDRQILRGMRLAHLASDASYLGDC